MYIAEGVCEGLQIPGPTHLKQNPESLDAEETRG